MKQSVFLVILTLALVFALAGCSSPNRTNLNPSESGMLYYSYEELAQAKAEAAKDGFKNDDYGLKELKYYYVPFYAETRWQFSVGDLYDISMTVNYSSTEDKQRRNNFLLWISRGTEGKERFENRVNPPIPYENSPKPFEGVEGVYYREGNEYCGFYWLYDDNYCFMQITSDLMDEVRENDPDALKGPLFELRKVELK